MSKVNSKDVGIIYIVIAILCLANFFLGYKLISKVIKNHNSNLESKVIGYEEEAIPAFIAITDDGENIIGSTSNSEELNVEVTIDNFFLQVLLNSSTYMRLAYESEEGVIKDFGLTSFFFGKINFPFTPVTYIKSQFPAILNLVDAKAVSSNNYAIGNDDKSPTILEDIVFYEDPIEEGDEGQIEIGEGDNNAEAVVEIPEAVNLDHSNPYILIYHTHGTESFYPAEDDRFHTIERKYKD